MFKRALGVFFLLLFLAPAGVFAAPMAQAPTPEITPEPQTYVYQEIDGVTVKWSYDISAGDIMTAVLLVVLIFSVWGLGMLIIFTSGSNRNG